MIGFIGPSGSGKTTLIERLIELLTQRGLTVSALKHAHHGFDLDRPGKDSFRLRAAGAAQVLVAAPQRWALMTELRGEPPQLEQLLAQLAPCDLVLVEGFRREGSIARIEVRGRQVGAHASASAAAAAGADEASFAKATEAASASAAAAAEAEAEAIAIVCDDPIDTALPRFARDDVAAIAAFIVRQLGIDR